MPLRQHLLSFQRPRRARLPLRQRVAAPRRWALSARESPRPAGAVRRRLARPRQSGRTDELTDATGGTKLYLSPGLRYGLGPEIPLYGYYQFPLYEDLNQIQLTADRNLLFAPELPA